MVGECDIILTIYDSIYNLKTVILIIRKVIEIKLK